MCGFADFTIKAKRRRIEREGRDSKYTVQYISSVRVCSLTVLDDAKLSSANRFVRI